MNERTMKLEGKHIVLGVTGSIAAYKAASLVRCLVKEGAEVQVVMTPSAKEFISPLTMATLSQKPVASEFFNRRDGSWYSHVDIGLWADLMLVAPATAASIGKMANGIADNMLITTYLSMKAPTWIAPAMDLDMYKHPSTQQNVERLKSFGVKILDAEVGFLASGLEGKGRMMEPEAIANAVVNYFEAENNRPLLGKKVLITAGPTYENIDSVRYIGNYSTGKMGYALAEEAQQLGATVYLVLGPSALSSPKGVYTSRVSSANEMLKEAKELFPKCDIAIFAAAVADYRPEQTYEGKIKREKSNNTLQLKLTKNPDIAATLGATKKQNQLLVGFALEMDSDTDEVKAKMQRKGMDVMVLNSLADAGAGFGGDTNKITILTHKNSPISFPLKSKREVAKDIFTVIREELELGND